MTITTNDDNNSSLMETDEIHNDIYKYKYKCSECDALFTRADNRKRHFSKIHSTYRTIHTCIICEAIFYDTKSLREHRHSHKPSNGFKQYKTALNNTVSIYRKKYNKIMFTLTQSFLGDRKEMYELSKYELSNRGTMQLGVTFHAEFLKDVDENIRSELCIQPPSIQVLDPSSLKNDLNNFQIMAQKRIDDYLENGSGWILKEIICTDISFGTCRSLRGSCNLLDITFPSNIAEKSNITIGSHKNYDNSTCFFDAVAYHFVRSKNNDQIRRFIRDNMITNIKTPVAIKDISKFEEDNKKLNFKINVIHLYDDEPHALYCGKNIDAKNHITLILYKTEFNDQSINHYAYCIDKDKFLRRIYRAQKPFKKKIQYHKYVSYCPNCLSPIQCKLRNEYTLQAKVKLHMELCLKNKPQTVVVPEIGDTLHFRKYINKFPAPFIGVFDIETCKEIPTYPCLKCKDTTISCHHATTTESIQIPTTISYAIMDSNKKIIFHRVYTGYDCVDVFLDEILSHEEDLLNFIQKNMKMQLTENDVIRFKSSTYCHICEKPFKENDIRVRDHSHITGEFLGASHQGCNLNRIERTDIPILAHNFSGFDSHFLVHALKKHSSIERLEGLPYNTQKFRTLRINSYVFIDSLSFFQAPLNELVTNLANNKNHPFEILDQFELYPKNSELKTLLLRKGVYPYEFASSISDLEKCKNIPEQKYFYSSLTDSEITDDEYEHAKVVFKKFNCQNMIDYTQLYCTTDVALLLEVIAQFREQIMETFGLDCCHYISLPQMAFDCFLRSTGIEIELLTDIDQIQFIQQSIRGGVSFIAERYCVAEETEFEKTSLHYIDAINLYGASMLKKMPEKNFRWLDDDEIKNLDIESLNEDDENGYILEVDLSFDENLHTSQNSLPLAPDQTKFTEEKLSPYARKCHKLLYNTDKYSSTKLCATFESRNKYAVHYMTLKTYLKHGVKIMRIHRVLTFHQSKFIEPYIRICTQKRKDAISTFEKNIWKLMNNAIFGKFLQRDENHLVLKFCFNETQCKNALTNPRHKSFTIINENLVLAFAQVPKVYLNKAYPVGFSILEYSKQFMFSFFYETLRPLMYPHQVECIMSDTDSLCLKITQKRHQREDSFIDPIQKMLPILDTSNYPKTHPLYSENNAGKLGFFKDELAGNTMTKFIGLRSKTYAYELAEDSLLYNKCKGVKKAFKKSLAFNIFKKCLFTPSNEFVTMINIRSRNHIVETSKQLKLGLSPFDDKRYITEYCCIHTFPYGSKLIEQCEQNKKCILCK